ncbi:MAG: A/G-specific adenine glycosylase [Candidatus Latescibacterota bacterium]
MNFDPSTKIRNALNQWYAKHHRRLPWRETRDPYLIWVSEVMLQQTQVATVVPYYESFVKRFPYVGELASADLQEVLKVWEGMGYYARARNLHRAAIEVCDRYGGVVPNDPERFRSLHGVGPYICAAVQSISFGAPLAVVDGNVKRVLARLNGIETPVNRAAEQGAFAEAAGRLLDTADPGGFNQAVMELGALVCKPKSPSCEDCPVGEWCVARKENRLDELPVRVKRAPRPTQRVAVGVVENDDRILITLRKPEGLLGGLWEFPGGKIAEGESARDACSREIAEETGLSVEVGEHVARVSHGYTHLKVEIDVFRCRFRGGDVVLDGPVDYRWIQLDDIGRFPIPKASHKIIPHLKKSGL